MTRRLPGHGSVPPRPAVVLSVDFSDPFAPPIWIERVGDGFGWLSQRTLDPHGGLMRHRRLLLSLGLSTAVLAAAAAWVWQANRTPGTSSIAGAADGEGQGGVEARPPVRYSIVVRGPSVLAEEKPDGTFTIPVVNDTGRHVGRRLSDQSLTPSWDRLACGQAATARSGH